MATLSGPPRVRATVDGLIAHAGSNSAEATSPKKSIVCLCPGMAVVVDDAASGIVVLPAPASEHDTSAGLTTATSRTVTLNRRTLPVDNLTMQRGEITRA